MMWPSFWLSWCRSIWDVRCSWSHQAVTYICSPATPRQIAQLDKNSRQQAARTTRNFLKSLLCFWDNLCYLRKLFERKNMYKFQEKCNLWKPMLWAVDITLHNHMTVSEMSIILQGTFVWNALQVLDIRKNLGRLWLAYTELQGDFTCFYSYLLTLGTLHG